MALITPKANTPIADPDSLGLFEKLWWLFFNALAAAANSLREDLDELTDIVEALTPGTTASHWLAYSATADDTIASPATPADGDLFSLKVEMDSTGGWDINFDATFQRVTAEKVERRAGWITLLDFRGGDGFWWLFHAEAYKP